MSFHGTSLCLTIAGAWMPAVRKSKHTEEGELNVC